MPTLQQLVDATPSGGTLLLTQDYTLTSLIAITKTIKIRSSDDSIPRRIHMASSPDPYLVLFLIMPLSWRGNRLSDEVYPLSTRAVQCKSWTATLKAGSKVNIGANNDKRYFVMYGIDPFDPNELHFSAVVDGNEWPRPTFDINGTTHYYIELSTNVDGTELDNMILSHAMDNTANLDMCISVSYARDIRLTRMRGAHYCTIAVGYSKDIFIDDIDVIVYPHAFPPPNQDQLLAVSGQVFAFGSVHGVHIGKVVVNYSSIKSPISCEVWCGAVSIDNFRLIRRDEGYWPTGQFSPHPIFTMQGGSDSILVKHMSIESPGPSLNYMWDVGGELGQHPPIIGSLRLRSDSWQNQPEVVIGETIIDPLPGGW